MERKFILLTGPPGIGKTTIIKKLVNRLKDKQFCLNGFYTEELRNDLNKRIGFDIVTLDGKRDKLARLSDCTPSNEITKYKVGQYVVFPNLFENMVMPLFQMTSDILVVDEIGRMELFSDKFKREIIKVFETPCILIATIPLPKGPPNMLLDTLRNHPLSELVQVNNDNRNGLVDQLCESIQKKLVK